MIHHLRVSSARFARSAELYHTYIRTDNYQHSEYILSCTGVSLDLTPYPSVEMAILVLRDVLVSAGS